MFDFFISKLYSSYFIILLGLEQQLFSLLLYKKNSFQDLLCPSIIYCTLLYIYHILQHTITLFQQKGGGEQTVIYLSFLAPDITNPAMSAVPGLGIHSFQKNVSFFAFFSVLLKRTFRSLRSFLFF